MLANDRRERQLGGGQVDAALEPVCQIWDGQRFHVLEPDLGDLIADSRPRLIVRTGKDRSFAAAGDGQPALFIQRPANAAVLNRARGGGFAGNHGFFVRRAVIDRVFVRVGGKCRDGQRKQHTKSQHKCSKFLKILHHAASFSFTAAIVNTIVAALMFVTTSLAKTFAL